MNRSIGTLTVALGVAAGVGGWIYAGVPRDAANWVVCVLVMIISAIVTLVGVSIWLEDNR